MSRMGAKLTCTHVLYVYRFFKQENDSLNQTHMCGHFLVSYLSSRTWLRLGTTFEVVPPRQFSKE